MSLQETREALQQALDAVERAQTCSTTSAHFASHPGWRTEWDGPKGADWSRRHLLTAARELTELAEAAAVAARLTTVLYDELGEARS